MHPRDLTVRTILKRVEYHGQVWLEVLELEKALKPLGSPYTASNPPRYPGTGQQK